MKHGLVYSRIEKGVFSDEHLCYIQHFLNGNLEEACLFVHKTTVDESLGLVRAIFVDKKYPYASVSISENGSGQNLRFQIPFENLIASDKLPW